MLVQPDDDNSVNLLQELDKVNLERRLSLFILAGIIGVLLGLVLHYHYIASLFV